MRRMNKPSTCAKRYICWHVQEEFKRLVSLSSVGSRSACKAMSAVQVTSSGVLYHARKKLTPRTIWPDRPEGMMPEMQL